jgi:hypothetical protein
MKALSPHHPRIHKHQLDLVGRRCNIDALACLGGLEQKLRGVSQRRAVRDIREAVEKQAAHVTQFFKALAVFKHQRPAQLSVPWLGVHLCVMQPENEKRVPE